MPAILKLVSPAPAEIGSNVSAKLMREEITMVAHDLRNPLACVVSTLELLEAKAEKSGLKNEVANVVRRGLRAAERMENMIQRLLDKAGQLESTQTLDESVCSLRFIAEAAIQHSFLHALTKGISIRLTGTDIPAYTDENLLIEAVDNLISNAVKYSQPDTEVLCQVGQDDRSVFIRISDQGKGLSQWDLQRVGQPFQQLSANPTAGETSTGLGLWATRRIADALGGELCAESAGVNAGATFTLRLPVLMAVPKRF